MIKAKGLKVGSMLEFRTWPDLDGKSHRREEIGIVLGQNKHSVTIFWIKRNGRASTDDVNVARDGGVYNPGVKRLRIR